MQYPVGEKRIKKGIEKSTKKIKAAGPYLSFQSLKDLAQSDSSRARTDGERERECVCRPIDRDDTRHAQGKRFARYASRKRGGRKRRNSGQR